MKHLFSLLKHFLLWIVCFATGRICFLIANLALLEGTPFAEAVSSFSHAFRLDLSTWCYLSVIPLLLLSLHLMFGKKWIFSLLKTYTVIFIVLYAIIVFVDISVYSEWATKLNYKALQYIAHPMEIVQSASAAHTATVLIGTLSFSALFIFLYLKFIGKEPEKATSKLRFVQAAAIILLGEPLLFAGIRGGFQQIPVSQSAVYFSKYQVLNDATVNPAWNLGHSILNFSKLSSTNPYLVMNEEKARKIVDNLYSVEQDTTVNILKINPEQVNVVIILLESWSADLIESLTGEKEVTPNFHELEKQGLLFTRFYANGHRSQLGISALLSGFPCVPDLSITDNIEKYSTLNSVIKDINSRYSTSFYFGGDLAYGNLRAYLMSNQFDNLYDEKAFPKEFPRGKLSIFDQYTLDYHAEQMGKEKRPFFSILFTGSTHSPYDEPKIVKQISRDCVELKYLNSAKYTDYCLGEYFKKVKNEPWYDNTLFILVADHSHQTHYKRDYFSAEYQHIPMLWLGGALKDEYKGRQWDKICSHIDLSKTILVQLGFPGDKYGWSRNIFNPHEQSGVPVEVPNGLGWICEDGYLRYAGNPDEFSVVKGFKDTTNLATEKERVAAYLQVLYSQYLKM